MARSEPGAVMRAPLAGLLAWLIPGLGHFYLGHQTRGLVFLVAITATFWSGVAIGGVRSTVDPGERKLWFVAQLCTGGNTLSAWAWNERTTIGRAGTYEPPQRSHWMRADVGVHYTGVAGLLNLLIILDAIGRASYSSVGRPERRRGAEAAT
ncbi:MAG: DUF6677 family protein [Phycisphaerae bacterium]